MLLTQMALLSPFLKENLLYAFGVLLAAICGGIIGYERKSRLKEAGLRTHIIVATAASVMTIISKYGFMDVLSESIKLDPSRVAAGVATAISFLGAGIIFMRKDTIFGLTTAAGLWATVGVGMASGARMYLLAIFSTLLIILVQVLTHNCPRLERSDIEQHLRIRVARAQGAAALVEELLTVRKMTIFNIQATKIDPEITEISVTVKCPEGYDPVCLFELLDTESNIISIEI